MTYFTRSKTTLLALAVGLLGSYAAQAQQGLPTVVIPTDGGVSLAATTASSAAPAASAAPSAASATVLKMNLPPAPEENAHFYDDSHKDLHQSLSWMVESNSLVPTYWNLYTEARIRLKLKDYAGARSTAEKAHDLSLKNLPASQEYVLRCADLLAKANELTQK